MTIQQQTSPLDPIITLFRKDSMVSVMDFFINDSDPEEYYRKTDVERKINLNRESIRQAIGSANEPGPLILFGIIDINSTEVPHPRYTLADTKIVSLITKYRNMDSTPQLAQFFDSSATQKLTQFFMIQADPDKSYSRYQLTQKTQISYKGTASIERYAEHGLVSTTTDCNDTTQYSYSMDTDFHRFCLYLNSKLPETHTRRQKEYGVMK